MSNGDTANEGAPFNRSISARAAIFLAICLWGLAPVTTRYLVASLKPLTLLAVRFGISAVLLAIALVVLRSWKSFSRSDALLVAACGLVGIIGYNVPVTFGIAWVPAGIAGLIIATEPVWIVVIGMIWLHESVSRWFWLGAALATTGVITLLLRERSYQIEAQSGLFIFGSALILLGAMMWSAYTVMIRRVSQAYGTLQSTAVTTIIGSILLVAAAWWQAPQDLTVAHLDQAGWIALLVVALGSTVIATLCWNYGVAHVSGAQAGLFLYLIPLISLLGGNLFLREAIRPGAVASSLLIISGVALAQLRSQPRIKTASAVSRIDAEETAR